jgi:biopolymer transport protein ExbD
MGNSKRDPTMAMEIRPGSSDDDMMVEINTTPLIDVMLVLLIMLIITIPIQTHAVKMNMPAATSTPPLKPPEVVHLDLALDGTVRWNGEVLTNDAELQSRLGALAAAASPAEVHVHPAAQVAYKHVAHVLAMAQRQGVAKIGITSGEQHF